MQNVKPDHDKMKTKFQIINEEYSQLPDSAKVRILTDALSLMEHNNNRTPNDCILLAMNYKPIKYDNCITQYIKDQA